MPYKMHRYQDAMFKPLKMAKPFTPTIQLLSGANIESSYSLFSLFISQELITLLSSNTNKYVKANNAGKTRQE
jgi:hypothetical protein